MHYSQAVCMGRKTELTWLPFFRLNDYWDINVYRVNKKFAFAVLKQNTCTMLAVSFQALLICVYSIIAVGDLMMMEKQLMDLTV